MSGEARQRPAADGASKSTSNSSSKSSNKSAIAEVAHIPSYQDVAIQGNRPEYGQDLPEETFDPITTDNAAQIDAAVGIDPAGLSDESDAGDGGTTQTSPGESSAGTPATDEKDAKGEDKETKGTGDKGNGAVDDEEGAGQDENDKQASKDKDKKEAKEKKKKEKGKKDKAGESGAVAGEPVEEADVVGEAAYQEPEQEQALPVLPMPVMGGIPTPVVPSPPRPALERSEEIKQRTGYSPEMHHVQVRQAVQRVAEEGRSAQRYVVWQVTEIAKETRLSIEELADEIPSVVAAAVDHIHKKIEDAERDISHASQKQQDHIETHGVLVGKELKKNREATRIKMWKDLKKGSADIEAADKRIRETFSTYLNMASMQFLTLPYTGKVVRLPLPPPPKGAKTDKQGDGKKADEKKAGGKGGDTKNDDGKKTASTTIYEAKAELEATSETLASIHTSPKTKAYKRFRSDPVLNRLSIKEQAAIIKDKNKRYKTLNSDATRAQFAVLALGLTAPVKEAKDKDTGKTTKTEKQQNTLQARVANRRKNAAKQELAKRSAGVILHLDSELKPQLSKNIYKAGRKAERGMRHQAKVTELALNSSATAMADAYRDLVKRIKTLIAGGRFLDARQLLPRLQQASQSIEQMRKGHYNATSTQSQNTLQQFQKNQLQIFLSLWKVARQSGESIGDVVTKSRFDFLFYAEEMTGHMHKDKQNIMSGARAYAERMARKITKATGQMDKQGIPLLDRVAINFLNKHLIAAEQAQHFRLGAFVKRMGTIPGGVLFKIYKDVESDIESRTDKIDNAMPERTAGGVAKSLVFGIVGGGVYLYKTRVQEDKVISALGGIPWPGAPALEEVFREKLYGSLKGRIKGRMGIPEMFHALNLLNEDPGVRGRARMNIAKESTRWFGYNRTAREDTLKALSKEERAALKPKEIEKTRDMLMDDLKGTEEEISLGYLDRNRERVAAARMLEAVDKARRKGMTPDRSRYGLVVAQRRGDQALVDAVSQFDAFIRKEYAIENAYIEDDDLKGYRKKAFHQFALQTRPLVRFFNSSISDEKAREAVIQYVSADRHLGPAHMPSVAASTETQNYIRATVSHGAQSEQAWSARAAYEIKRGGREGLTETTTLRLTKALENPRYYQLVRQHKEEKDPERRARLEEQLLAEQGKHQKRMLQLAKRLGAPTDDLKSPQAATDWLSKKMSNTFAGKRAIHGRYGKELIEQGRASLVAGVELATKGVGTHEDLLRHTFKDRSKTEIKDAREEWKDTHNGEDMDVMLGIKKRPMSKTEKGLLAISPAAGLGAWLYNAPETSGDLAMELQRLAKGNPENDADHAELAALRYKQERKEGTGFIARRTMRGTPEARSLDQRRLHLANLLVAAVPKKNEKAAAFYRDYPEAVFNEDGTIAAGLRHLAFNKDGNFNGDRAAFHILTNRVNLAADSYKAEIDRQEAILTSIITVLAIVVSIALMFIPGVNLVAAGILTALIAGAATMTAKYGMRGERYGWEEAATDLASTGIQAATAGIGGAMAGGLGKAGILFKAGDALNKSLGKVGGTMAREALVSLVSGTAQVGLQDETWRDGFGRGLEKSLAGGVKQAGISMVTAGVSESLGNRMSNAMRTGMRKPTDLSRWQRMGQRLGPSGREIFKESISETIGAVAGESLSILIEVADGKYRGGLKGALERIGLAGLKDMVTAAGRAGARSYNQARYQELLTAARGAGQLNDADLRVLRLAAISAGEMFYGDDVSVAQRQVDAGNDVLGRLKGLPEDNMHVQALREQAEGFDADTLLRMYALMESGAMGNPAERMEFMRDVGDKYPEIDLREFARNLLSVGSEIRQRQDREVMLEALHQKQVRNELLSGLEGPARRALRSTSVEGIDLLPQVELRQAADMVRRGQFDLETADALLRAAKIQNPDLDEFTFMRNLYNAVDTSNLAQQAERAVRVKQRQDVMDAVPETARQVFADLPDAAIGRVKQLLDQQSTGSVQQQDSLYRMALQQNPELTRDQFHGFLDAAVSEVKARATEASQMAREQRQRHMSNVPEDIRSLLSALPDDALIELRVRQMQGGELSVQERQRLLDAAQRTTPDVDLVRLSEALNEALATPVQRLVSGAEEMDMRRELEAALPKDQRDQVKDVAILVMRADEFESFTRSKKGEAVTLIIDGRPVVVIREGADPSVLREEGIHVLQSKDPAWADRIGSLDERKLAEWDQLSLREQLTLYRNKIEIEIDAQQRLLQSMEDRRSRFMSAEDTAKLHQQIELAQATLVNLGRRRVEAGGINELKQRQIKAGIIPRPDWLDQPARLFSKESLAEQLMVRAAELHKKLGKMSKDQLRKELEAPDIRADMEPAAALLRQLPDDTDTDVIRDVVAAAKMLREAGLGAEDMSYLIGKFTATTPAAQARMLADFYRDMKSRGVETLGKRLVALKPIQSAVRQLEQADIPEARKQALLKLVLGEQSIFDVARIPSRAKNVDKLLQSVELMMRQLPDAELDKVVNRLLEKTGGLYRSKFDTVLDDLREFLDFSSTLSPELAPVVLSRAIDMFIAKPFEFRKNSIVIREIVTVLRPYPAMMADAMTVSALLNKPGVVRGKLASLGEAIHQGRPQSEVEVLAREFGDFLKYHIETPGRLERAATIAPAEQRLAVLEQHAAKALQQAETVGKAAHEGVAKARSEMEEWNKLATSYDAEAKVQRSSAENDEAQALRLRAEGKIEEASTAEQRAEQARKTATKADQNAKDARAEAASHRSKAETLEAAVAKTRERVRRTGKDVEAAEDSLNKQRALAEKLDDLELQERLIFARNDGTEPATGSTDGKLLHRIRSEINETTRQLENEITAATGLTEDVRKELRDGTPDKETRKRVLGDPQAEDRGPTGKPRDWITGEEISPSDASPDHIYSVSKIFDEPGFGELPRAIQKEILEMEINLAPMQRSRNESKGDRDIATWLGSESKLAPKLTPEQRKAVLEREQRAQEAVKARIKEEVEKWRSR